MKDALDGHSLGEQIRSDQDAAEQQMIQEAIGRIDMTLNAAKESVFETLKQGENMLKRARNSTEGYVDDAIHEVKHNPVSAMALAFASGAITAGILALGWKWAKRSPKSTSAD